MSFEIKKGDPILSPDGERVVAHAACDVSVRCDELCVRWEHRERDDDDFVTRVTTGDVIIRSPFNSRAVRVLIASGDWESKHSFSDEMFK